MSTLEVVARFLALLDLHTRGSVSLEQLNALGELHVRWTAAESDDDAEDGAEWDDLGPDASGQDLVRDDGVRPRPG